MKRRAAARLMLGGVGLAVANAVWIEPRRLTVTRREVWMPGLPPAIDGLKVALLSDFHYRPVADWELMDKVVHAVRREKPGLVALTGDYISKDPMVFDPLMEHLGKLEATHGVVAVMGNHDGWNGSTGVIRRRFEKAGIGFLNNQNTRIGIVGEALAVAGTDFVWHGRPDPDRALRGIHPDVPVLALVHEPDYFDVMAERRPGLLQVSGHTHGGQCRVPVAGYAPARVSYGKKYLEGLFHRERSRLFVTRGVGTTGPRVRFACPPELAMLTLRSG